MAVEALRLPVEAFAVRLPVVFAPFVRGAAFFAVRAVPLFAVLRDVVLREVVLRDAVLRDAVPADLVARRAGAALRVPVAAFARDVPVLARELLAAALPRVDLAAVVRPVLPPERDEALFVPARLDAALVLPALARPPFAAAAVRPAAPRALVPALRAAVPLFARVPLAALVLRVAVVREPDAVERRAGARRRRGVSSVEPWPPES